MFSDYRELQKRFKFHNRIEAVTLVIGGLILGILDTVGVAAIFPLMLIVIDPGAGSEGRIVGAIHTFVGIEDKRHLGLFLAFLVIGLFGAKVVFNLVLWRYEFKLLNKWRIDIASQIFRGLMYANYEKFNVKGSAYYINIIGSVIPYIVSNYFYQVIALIQTILMAALITAFMFYINPFLFIFVCLIGFSIIYGFLFAQRKKLQELGGTLQTLKGSFLKVLQQSIAGYKDTRIHQKEHFFSERFVHSSIGIARVDLSLVFIQHLPSILVEFIAIVIILSSFVGMLFITENLQSAAVNITAVVILGLRIIPLINRSINSLSLIRSSIIPISQLYDTYDILFSPGENLEIYSPPKQPIEFEKEITFSNVYFGYRNGSESVLHDLSLRIPKGTHLGIVGASGSGKTTLIYILLGFLTDYGGHYLIDGVPIVGENISRMRSIISYVDQQPFLLEGTLAENVAYGVRPENIDEERVSNCLQSVGLWGLAVNEKGADNKAENKTIGENGKFLSGGQRQRLAIARALYKGAKILILDEASSSLDMDSESELIELIDSMDDDITVISIAHRLSTLRNCNQIIFMEGMGRQSTGGFKELYKNNDTFKRYVDSSAIDVS